MSLVEVAFVKRVEELRRRLVACPDDEHEALMLELWDLVCTIGEDAVVDRVMGLDACQRHRGFLATGWADHLSRLEAERSRKILVAPPGSDDPSSVLAVEGYAGIGAELALVTGRTYRRLVMVGCGPYPETLMALSDSGILDGEACGVDRNPVAADLARRVVQGRRRRGDTILSIEHGEGAAFDYTGADLVLLANGLFRKGDVLERVGRTAAPGVRLLVRAPLLMGRLLYEDVPADSHAGWRVAGLTRPSPLSQTRLLMRRS